MAIYGGLSTWPTAVSSFHEAGQHLIWQIPEDGEFQYNNGTLTTNLTTPLYLESPKEWKDFEFPRFFAGLSKEEEALDSFLTFSPTSIYLRAQGKVDSLKYTEFVPKDSGSFTRKDLENGFEKAVQSLHDNAWLFMIAFSVIWFVSKVVGGVIMITIFTFVVQSMAWLAGVRLTYKQFFRWGLHIYPIAIGADFLSSLLTRDSHYPLVTIIYLLFAAGILWRARTVQRTIHHV